MRVVDVETVGECAIGQRRLRWYSGEVRAPDGGRPRAVPARHEPVHRRDVLLAGAGQRAADRVEHAQGGVVHHGGRHAVGPKTVRPLGEAACRGFHAFFPRGRATVAVLLAVISCRWFSAVSSRSTTACPPSSRLAVTTPRHHVTSPIRLWRRTWAERRRS